MSRRTVPASTQIVCDRCGCVCDFAHDNYRKEGRLILNADTAHEPYTYDLCDSCTTVMVNSLKNIMGSKPLVGTTEADSNFMKGSLR